MTVGRPLYLDGITNYTADEFRTLIDGLAPSPGVIVQGSPSGNLGTAPTGPVSMAVQVATGMCVVPAKSTANGKYLLEVTAPETVTIAAASAQNRIDIVVAQVLDTAFSDASNTGQIVAITGTPSGTPVAPATPTNAVLLATVAVNTGAATIVAGNITDSRQYTAAAGGLTLALNQAARDALTKWAGRAVYRFDTKTIETCDGTAWAAPSVPFVGARATAATAQALTASTVTTLTNNGTNPWTATEDSGGYVSATGGTTTPITIPAGKGGRYLVGVKYAQSLSSSGRAFVDILVNGATAGLRTVFSTDANGAACHIVRLNAGDTLGLQAFTSTAASTSSPQVYCQFLSV
jgi:hypothetical protein